jgi:argininosuccinate lyase
VAVDLRLYGKMELLAVLDETADLAAALLAFAGRHADVPMVGRTHMQPAMPSSVGLWASAYAEGLLDDATLLGSAYELNDACPLGAAAGYGVSLPIDRALSARLLGFRAPQRNVLHAGNSRGKTEAAILSAASQVMLSLSRLAQDLMITTMPEFGYFRLPEAYCTGSSVMPHKRNPDVLELVRARTAGVIQGAAAAAEIVRGLPGGYNRDLQETKKVFIEGIRTTGASLRVMTRLVKKLKANRKALASGFSPEVFATDRALELVADGMPFRDAYNHVKTHLKELAQVDPPSTVGRKTHLGATGNLGLAALQKDVTALKRSTADRRKGFHRAIARLLGVAYPRLRK